MSSFLVTIAMSLVTWFDHHLLDMTTGQISARYVHKAWKYQSGDEEDGLVSYYLYFKNSKKSFVQKR